jgi:hypothetical protein
MTARSSPHFSQRVAGEVGAASSGGGRSLGGVGERGAHGEPFLGMRQRPAARAGALCRDAQKAAARRR